MDENNVTMGATMSSTRYDTLELGCELVTTAISLSIRILETLLPIAAIVNDKVERSNMINIR